MSTLPGKPCLRNYLLYVEWDVNLYSLSDQTTAIYTVHVTVFVIEENLQLQLIIRIRQGFASYLGSFLFPVVLSVQLHHVSICGAEGRVFKIYLLKYCVHYDRNPLVYLDETALRLAVRLAQDANRNECAFLLMGSLASESGVPLFNIVTLCT